MKAGELHYLSIGELSRLIAAREVSPVELVTSVLERVERVDGTLNTYITLLKEEARETAREAERAILAGNLRGPLHGIPVAVKDIIYTRGVRTTAGSRILADFVPREDATVVERLKDGGAILLGKLNCHEFAWGATNINPHYGNTRNPWDPGHIAGGSSGGSGAAVAAGLCIAALGTDTGGSVRIPSSLCGIVGLKPTYGRVSRHGVIPLSWSLDHLGPMTRTVEDAAILLGCIAGGDPRDASSSPGPVPDYTHSLAGDVRGVRVGIPREYFYDGLDGEVEAAVQEAIGALEGLGARAEEVSFPWARECYTIANLIHLPESSAYHEEYLKRQPQDYGSDVRSRLELGRLVLATDYLKAQRARSLVARAFSELMQRVDLLVTATVPIPAPRMDEEKVDFGGEQVDVRLVLSRLTRPFNVTGSPAITVPCGFTSVGLPIGLQIAGRAFEEETVLRVAHAYEVSSPWRGRRPAI